VVTKFRNERPHPAIRISVYIYLALTFLTVS
jgi:hypothetical protein